MQVGLGDTMDVLDSSRREADRSTHTDDLVALESVAALHPDAASFEAWLRDLLARPPSSGPGVLLSTIHKIKGREWEHVIIYGASQGLLPHRLSDDEEGERRVFHVALTRAIRQVVVLADAEAPSPFVAELDGSRPRQPIGMAGGPRRAEREVRSSQAKPAVRSMPQVAAEVGLALDYGGHGGTVVDLSESAAVVAGRCGTTDDRVRDRGAGAGSHRGTDRAGRRRALRAPLSPTRVHCANGDRVWPSASHSRPTSY